MEVLEPLRRRAVEPTTLVYCSRHGQEIWREPRGTAAGYPWPQVSIHRGVLQEVLLGELEERVGADHVHLGHQLVRVDTDDERGDAVFRTPDDDSIVASGTRSSRTLRGISAVRYIAPHRRTALSAWSSQRRSARGPGGALDPGDGRRRESARCGVDRLA